MRKSASIIMAVLIILGMDTGIAGYCRFNCDFWQSAYPGTDHRIRSDEFHHGLAANREITEAWGLYRYRYATNSLGFKDETPRKVDLVSNGRRILFLGDSFVEGKGFAFKDTFVGLISKAMNKKGIEVLNGGVDSYAPVIYRLKAKYLLDNVGLQFDTVVVFLDISDIYDQALRYKYDDQGKLLVPPRERPSALKRGVMFLRDRSAIFRFSYLSYDYLARFLQIAFSRAEIAIAKGKNPWSVNSTDMWIDTTTNYKPSAWSYDEKRWQEYGKRGRKLALKEMDGLWQLLKSHGVNLVVAVYPWPDQLFHDPQAPRHRGFWRHWSKANGVQFIDLFPAFTKGKPRDVLEKYYISQDVHWNIEGHRLVASTFLDKFRM